MDLAGRPVPTTFEIVEGLALRHPDRLAVAQGARQWSYRDLHQGLLRFSGQLHRLGVRRGQRVAIGSPGLYLELLLLIACESLGAVTTSFLTRVDPDARVLFGLVDWVLADAPQDCPESARFQLLDQAFADEAMAIDPGAVLPPRVALAWHEPQRISRTSGSSGHSKFMLLSRQAQEYWVRIGAENGGYRADSRLLVAGPFVINACFARASACLRAGAAVLDAGAAARPGASITHLLALPLRLDELLAQLPPGQVWPNPVDVGTVGGFLSPELRQRAQRVFHGRIVSRYGANELGGVCDDLDATGTGWVSAGVDVRILDAQGHELPEGEVGVIAVRTPSMVAGYLNEPEATESAFRDGWFVSGDLGALQGPRLLRLVGRHDDLINLGGVKVPAVQLESSIRQHDGVRDCAVLAVNIASGSVTLGIALVLEAGVAVSALSGQLEQALSVYGKAQARIIVLPELPRMPTGKLDRLALHRAFAERVPSQA